MVDPLHHKDFACGVVVTSFHEALYDLPRGERRGREARLPFGLSLSGLNDGAYLFRQALVGSLRTHP